MEEMSFGAFCTFGTHCLVGLPRNYPSKLSGPGYDASSSLTLLYPFAGKEKLHCERGHVPVRLPVDLMPPVSTGDTKSDGAHNRSMRAIEFTVSWPVLLAPYSAVRSSASMTHSFVKVSTTCKHHLMH